MTSPISVVRYATGSCTLGHLLLGVTAADEICAILLGDDAEGLIADLRRRLPSDELVHAPMPLAEDLTALLRFVDNPSASPLALQRPFAVRGTAFQRQVWDTLRLVKAGETISYSELAQRVGNPSAVRAVAGACAANPLAIVVPCHRVLRSDGGISGYRWGVERKRQLLALEAGLAVGA